MDKSTYDAANKFLDALEQWLPSPEREFGIMEKLFWVIISERLGPKSVEEFKNVAQFMSAVSEY